MSRLTDLISQAKARDPQMGGSGFGDHGALACPFPPTLADHHDPASSSWPMEPMAASERWR